MIETAKTVCTHACRAHGGGWGSAARIFTAVLIVLALAVVALPTSASARPRAITRAHADRIALRTLHGLRYSPIVLFGLPRALPKGTRVSLAEAGSKGSRRLRQSGWLFWADLQPGFYFDHIGSVVVIARQGGRVLLHEPTLNWPLVNGRPPAFLRSTRSYDAGRYRVLSRGGQATVAASSASRAAEPVASIAAGSGARCVIVAGPPRNVLSNPLAIFTWGGHLNDADQFTTLIQRLGLPVRNVNNLAELRDALDSAPQQGCTDVLLFMTGEGSPVPSPVPGPLQGLLGGRRYIFGNPNPNIELGPNTRVTAKQLAKALQDAYNGAPAGAKPGFTVMLQECFGGRMFAAVEKVSGVRLIATSASAGTEASRNAVGGASPWVDGMGDGIQTAIENATGHVIPWDDAVGKAFNGLPPTQDTPELDVQGKIISRPPPAPNPCAQPGSHGGIDLLLEGEFFGSQWAAGTVTATSSSGAAPESASEGYDYVSEGHFGPWACGSTTTLTATPARGSHFDRWASGTGLCAATKSLTCKVPITTDTDQITAYFAPTVYSLAVTNEQPDGIVTSGGGGGGYVNPGIHCGSQPNGPTTNTYTDCSAGAIAQRSDTDVTELTISADNPGPGNQTYGVTSVTGCDSTTAVTSTNPHGGTYHPSYQCFLDVNSNRAITVSYVSEGPAF